MKMFLKIFAFLAVLSPVATRAADYNISLSGLTTDSLTNSQSIMVKFTASVDRLVPSISLYAGKVGAPAGPLRAAIMNDVSGAPDCSSSPMFTIPAASVSTTPGFVELTCADGCVPILTAGDTYWLVVYNQADPNNRQYFIGSNSNTDFDTYFSVDGGICDPGVLLGTGLVFAPYSVAGTPTITDSPTISPTWTITKTPTASVTASHSATQTTTWTPTLSPVLTATPTSTTSPTPRATYTNTRTNSPTTAPTVLTATTTSTPKKTFTSTNTRTKSPTPTSSWTTSPTPTFSRTVTLTATQTSSPLGTATTTTSPTPRSTNTISPTPTDTKTFTSTSTVTRTRTSSTTTTPTATVSTSPTPTMTKTPAGCDYQFAIQYTDAPNLGQPEAIWNSISNDGLYISNFTTSPKSITKFDYAGNFISNFDVSGVSAYFVLQDSVGNFFVSADGAGRVMEYDSSGIYVQDVTLNLDSGSYASGLAIDENDNLFVAELGDNGASIEKFNPALTPIATFESFDGSYFEGLTYCQSCGPNGTIYAADPGFQYNNLGVRAIDAVTMQQLTAFGPEGNGEGELNYPESVAVTAGGLVLVSDWSSQNPYINVFRQNGQFVSRFTSPSGALSTGGAVGLAIAPDGSVWSSDDTDSLYKFVPCGGTATPTKTATPTASPTSTITPTVTPRFSNTSSPTLTSTRTPGTATTTRSPTPVFTSTHTPTISASSTPFTPTATLTATAQATFTDSPTPTITKTSTRSPTPSSTRTPSFTFSLTPTPTRTSTPTITKTITATPSITNTLTATKTITRTFTFSPTVTPSRTITLTNTPTRTPTPTFTRTFTLTRTPTTSPTFTATPTPP